MVFPFGEKRASTDTKKKTHHTTRKLGVALSDCVYYPIETHFEVVSELTQKTPRKFRPLKTLITQSKGADIDHFAVESYRFDT